MEATVKLKFPAEHNGKTYNELTFRRAKFGDFCKADKVSGDNDKTAAVLASMSGTTIQTIQDIDMEDMAAVLEVAGPLMGNVHLAATEPSPE